MTELTQKFNEEFSKHARELEGEKHEIYIDSKGIPTIGVGYALIHRIGDKWEPNLSGLKESGVNPSKSLVNDLSQYAEALSGSKPTEDLRARLKISDFRIDAATSQRLLDYSIRDKLRIITSKIEKRTWEDLPPARQIALLDYVFHRGSIPSNLAEAIKGRDYNKAADIVGGDGKQGSFDARFKHNSRMIREGTERFENTHVVRSGETFNVIAKKHHIPPEELRRLNPGTDPSKLQVLQMLNVPKTSAPVSDDSTPKQADVNSVISQSTENKPTIVNKILDKVGEIAGALNPIKDAHASDRHADTKTTDSAEAQSETSPGEGSNLLPRQHTVVKGDTAWKIARDHGMTTDALLAIPGNEYLKARVAKDGFGRDHVTIRPGDIVRVPAGSKTPYIWQRHSDYGTPIFTTSGMYDFMTPFNQGSYNSPLALDKQLYRPFVWYNTYPSYDQLYLTLTNTLREAGLYSWQQQSYTAQQPSSQKQYSTTANLYTNAKQYAPPKSTGVFAAPSGQSGRTYNPPSGVGGWVNARETGFSFGISFGVSLPLIIDLKNDGLKTISLENSTAFYDIDDQGYLKNLGWLDAEDALVAIDVNDDGIISQAKEIIFKKWHEKAETDLDGLKLAFDRNQDGVVDSKDPDFARLLVWQDLNQNGVSEPNEMRSFKDVGIEAILLNEAAEIQLTQDASGNKILRAVKLHSSRTMGYLYDVALKTSDIGISYEEDYGRITLRYPDGKQAKVYKVETENGEQVDLKSDYEVILGNVGNDLLKSSDKSTALDGYEGDDTLIGGDGHDWLKGGDGSDKFNGGKGHDILLIDSLDKQENIDGGEGSDVALVATQEALQLDLAKANLEAVYGNMGYDKFTAKDSAVAVYIDAGAGDDDVEGGDHDDILLGGKGKDSIRGGKGDDSIFIDSEDDLANIDAGEGKDSIFVYGDKGIGLDAAKLNAEYIFGSLGDDNLYTSGKEGVVLVGNSGKDLLKGGEGNDILDGGKDDDRLEGSLGEDRYVFYKGAGHDVISNAHANTDILLLYSSADKKDLVFERSGLDLKLLLRNNGEDSLTIQDWYKAVDAKYQHKFKGIILNADTSEPQTLVFKDGDNNSFSMEDGKGVIIVTMEGDDQVGGADKNDFINSGKGKDKVLGLNGDDVIMGGQDEDSLQGGCGDDVYLFNRGDGKDTIFDACETVTQQVAIADVPRTVKDIEHGCILFVCYRHVRGTYTVYDKVPYTETKVTTHDGGKDTIQLGPNLSLENLLFSKNVDDLIIRIKSDTPDNADEDSITIQKWANQMYKIEYVKVDDYKIDMSLIDNFICASRAFNNSLNNNCWYSFSPGISNNQFCYFEYTIPQENLVAVINCNPYNKTVEITGKDWSVALNDIIKITNEIEGCSVELKDMPGVCFNVWC